MGRRLQYAVCLNDPDGNPVTITPDEDVPKWAVSLINPERFTDAAGSAGESGDEPDDPDAAPPRSGKGSGAAAWAAYAAAHDVEVPEDATRDEIIAAVEAAGVSAGSAGESGDEPDDPDAA